MRRQLPLFILYPESRVNNTEGVSWSIEAIITDVLEEGEWVNPTLLKPLLSCLKKGKKRVTPISAAMVERIIRICVATIQPLRKEAVQLEGSSVDSNASVVASICCGKLTCLVPAHSNGTSGTEEDVVLVKYPDSQKSVQADAEAGAFRDDNRMGHTGSTKFEMEICALPKKKSRKPNSLILPGEGYNHPGAGLHEDTPKPKHRRRTMDEAASVTLVEKSVVEHSPQKASKSLGVSVAGLKMSLESRSQSSSLKKAGSAEPVLFSYLPWHRQPEDEATKIFKKNEKAAAYGFANNYDFYSCWTRHRCSSPQ